MGKLVYASLVRLRKDKAFWIALLGTFLMALAVICNGAGSAERMRAEGWNRSLEDYFFNSVPFLGAIFSGFISLFLGRERGDGALRNKLIVGNTWEKVYFSNFLVCFVSSLCLTGAWILGSLPGFFLIGSFEMPPAEVAGYALTLVGVALSFSALFTWVGMLTDNKALTVVFGILLWLGLLMIASGLYDRLLEPEMHSGMTLINGQLVPQEASPNPLYLRGTVRTVCQCILEALPTGQTILMTGTDVAHPIRQFGFSLLVTALALAGGMASFRRKDLK